MKKAAFPQAWVVALAEVDSASEFTDESLALVAELFTSVAEVVEQRRAEPRDDLISLLLAARVDGTALEPIDINMSA